MIGAVYMILRMKMFQLHIRFPSRMGEDPYAMNWTWIDSFNIVREKKVKPIKMVDCFSFIFPFYKLTLLLTD